MKTPIRRDYTLGHYFVPKDCTNGIAVDIGANVGNFLEKYHQVFSKIDFYEPIKSCYELCLQKTKDIPSIRGFHEGVFSEEVSDAGVRMNNLDPYETGCVVDMPHLDDIDPEMKVFAKPFEKVNLVSLETVIARAGGKINYLKVDCEGSEYYVLNKKDLSKIKYIAVEFHGNLGGEKWKELCLWINRTHMIVHPQIVESEHAYLILTPQNPIVEVLYAPRIPGMTYVKLADGELELVSK